MVLRDMLTALVQSFSRVVFDTGS